MKQPTSMWLPPAERRLLQTYWHEIKDIHKDMTFSEIDLTQSLSLWDNRKHPLIKRPHVSSAKSLLKISRVSSANKLLDERNLINLRRQTGSATYMVTVSLTVDGLDLGRQYSNWVVRSGLWFVAYREHWLWLIFATIGGAIISRILD